MGNNTKGKMLRGGNKKDRVSTNPPAMGEGRRKGAVGLNEELALANALTRGMKFMGRGAPRRPPKVKKGPKGRMPKGPVMSLAAAKFAAAILNPWSPESMGSYIPIGNGRPTQKTNTFQRFDVTVGTAGIGWVAVCPCLSNGAAGGILAYYTTTAYAGTTCVPYLAVLTGTLNAGVSTLLCGNAAYSDAALSQRYTNAGFPTGNEVYGRIVSCGLTASYTGTTLNEGGLLYCFTDPDHASVIGHSVGSLGSRLETDVSNVSRMKCELVDYPLNDEEATLDRTTAYQAAAGSLLAAVAAPGVRPNMTAWYPFASSTAAVPDSGGFSQLGVPVVGGQPTMLVMITGTPGNTVHVEICQHCEYQGLGAEGRTTPSVIDRQGYEMVKGAASAAVQRKSNHGSGTYADEFVNALSEQAAALRPVSSRELANCVGSAV